MTQYEKDLLLANKILSVFKFVENDFNFPHPFDYTYNSTNQDSSLHHGYDAVIRLSNDMAYNSRCTSINIDRSIIRFIRNTNEFKITGYNGVMGTYKTNIPELELSEEQHFQNSLMYDDITNSSFIIYATLMQHDFKYKYSMISLNYLDLLLAGIEFNV